ncbi:MAG: zinc ABC transporter substrate-binding protein [Trueperaceae bacterium]|nr:zinc ABC transporter substrate-binding protein [Trueperaceae bacterium]
MNSSLKTLVSISKLLPLLLLLGGALTLSRAQPEPLNTVVTIGMIGDVVENVGGPCVSVSALMGPGVDPHLYQASASDVRTLQRSDAIFYAGYLLEGQLSEVLERFGERTPTLAVSPAAAPPETLVAVAPDDASYTIDPHLWMDASLWAQTVTPVAEQLAELLPDCRDTIASRAAIYRAELAALHDWAAASTATIPESQRVLVTAHDAFTYYGRAYGIEVAGIQGISTASEASLADIRSTVDLIVTREVPAIFVETSINPRTIDAVRAAARDRGFEVVIGGSLYSDAMGTQGTADGTYIGMIRSNTLAITDALGGTAAPWPEALAGWAERWNIIP